MFALVNLAELSGFLILVLFFLYLPTTVHSAEYWSHYTLVINIIIITIEIK